MGFYFNNLPSGKFAITCNLIFFLLIFVLLSGSEQSVKGFEVILEQNNVQDGVENKKIFHKINWKLFDRNKKLLRIFNITNILQPNVVHIRRCEIDKPESSCNASYSKNNKHFIRKKRQIALNENLISGKAYFSFHAPPPSVLSSSSARKTQNNGRKLFREPIYPSLNTNPVSKYFNSANSRINIFFFDSPQRNISPQPKTHRATSELLSDGLSFSTASNNFQSHRINSAPAEFSDRLYDSSSDKNGFKSFDRVPNIRKANLVFRKEISGDSPLLRHILSRTEGAEPSTLLSQKTFDINNLINEASVGHQSKQININDLQKTEPRKINSNILQENYNNVQSDNEANFNRQKDFTDHVKNFNDGNHYPTHPETVLLNPAVNLQRLNSDVQMQSPPALMFDNNQYSIGHMLRNSVKVLPAQSFSMSNNFYPTNSKIVNTSEKDTPRTQHVKNSVTVPVYFPAGWRHNLNSKTSRFSFNVRKNERSLDLSQHGELNPKMLLDAPLQSSNLGLPWITEPYITYEVSAGNASDKLNSFLPVNTAFTSLQMNSFDQNDQQDFLNKKLTNPTDIKRTENNFKKPLSADQPHSRSSDPVSLDLVQHITESNIQELIQRESLHSSAKFARPAVSEINFGQRLIASSQRYVPARDNKQFINNQQTHLAASPPSGDVTQSSNISTKSSSVSCAFCEIYNIETETCRFDPCCPLILAGLIGSKC